MRDLLTQNTQDLKKSLDKIKQRQIELGKDRRNDKNENDRLHMILSVIDRICQYF